MRRRGTCLWGATVNVRHEFAGAPFLALFARSGDVASIISRSAVKSSRLECEAPTFRKEREKWGTRQNGIASRIWPEQTAPNLRTGPPFSEHPS